MPCARTTAIPAAVAPSSDEGYSPAWRLIEAADLKKRADNLQVGQPCLAPIDL